MTLYDKLKALTAPCREADAEIADVFGAPNAHFTASLDATVDLVEREMPDLSEPEWSLQTAPGGYWACVGHEYNTAIGALHNLPAVALLMALLDAKGVSCDET